MQRAMRTVTASGTQSQRGSLIIMSLCGLLAIIIAFVSRFELLSYAAAGLAIILLGYPLLISFVPSYGRMCKHLLSYTPGQLRSLGLAEVALSAILAILLWYWFIA